MLRSVSALALSALVLLTGCGGGADSDDSARLQVTVRWPAASTRLIPSTTASLTFGVYRYYPWSGWGGYPVDPAYDAPLAPLATVERPAGVATATWTSPALPAGLPICLQVRAYSEPGGEGQMVGEGVQILQLVAGETGQARLSLESTIAATWAAVNAARLQPGESFTIEPAAMNENGDAVIVQPALWRYESLRPPVCRVEANGKVTAVADGLALIRVWYGEEPKASCTVAVGVDTGATAFRARLLTQGQYVDLATGTVSDEPANADLGLEEYGIEANPDRSLSFERLADYWWPQAAPRGDYNYPVYILDRSTLAVRAGQDEPVYYKLYALSTALHPVDTPPVGLVAWEPLAPPAEDPQD